MEMLELTSLGCTTWLSPFTLLIDERGGYGELYLEYSLSKDQNRLDDGVIGRGQGHLHMRLENERSS